jgi:hypothetical protein
MKPGIVAVLAADLCATNQLVTFVVADDVRGERDGTGKEAFADGVDVYGNVSALKATDLLGSEASTDGDLDVVASGLIETTTYFEDESFRDPVFCFAEASEGEIDEILAGVETNSGEFRAMSAKGEEAIDGGPG